MSKITTLLRLERDSYKCLVFALISLVQRCQAQEIDSTTTITISASIPALLFVIGLVLISVCFCAYQCQTYQSRRNYFSRRYRQSIRNRNQNLQNQLVISARPHPALTSLSSDTSLSDTPSPIIGNQPSTPQSTPQAFELVSSSLPEATLHQGLHTERRGSYV